MYKIPILYQTTLFTIQIIVKFKLMRPFPIKNLWMPYFKDYPIMNIGFPILSPYYDSKSTLKGE